MNSTKPLFSIVVPTHNRAVLLKRAIEKVIHQTYSNWELIVVDDGSTDDTAEIVKQFQEKRIRYIFQQHQERSTARNKGIELAKGDYICFLDDDDYYLPTYLQDFYEKLEQQNFPIKLLRTGFIRLHQNRRIKSLNYNDEHNQHPAHFFADNMCGVGSVCIPRTCLKEHQFHPDFKHWQDTHLILRLLALYPFQQLDSYNYVYVYHDAMGSAEIFTKADTLARVKTNTAAIHHFFDHYAELVKDILPDDSRAFLVSRKYLHYAKGSLRAGKWALAIRFTSISIKKGGYKWFLKDYIKLPFVQILRWWRA